MRRWISVGLWIVAALVIIDTGISLALTCHEQGYKPGSGQNFVEGCSVFQGPILRFVFWFANAFDKHGEAVIAFFTIVLAISTIGLWWSTRKLWEAGEKQIAVAAFAANSSEQSARAAQRAAAIMDQTAERQLRAYVLASECKISAIESIAEASVIAQNYGQTPAYELESWIGIRLRKFPVTDDLFETEAAPISKAAHGAGATFTMNCKAKRALTQEELAGIRDGSWGYFVVGAITYKDIFGHTQTTKMKFGSGGPLGPFPSDGRLMSCGDGNEAT